MINADRKTRNLNIVMQGQINDHMYTHILYITVFTYIPYLKIRSVSLLAYKLCNIY